MLLLTRGQTRGLVSSGGPAAVQNSLGAVISVKVGYDLLLTFLGRLI